MDDGHTSRIVRSADLRPSWREVVRRGLLVTVINAVALWLLAAVLDGFTIDTVAQGLLAGFVVGVANAVIWPALAFLIVPLSVLTLGLGAIILDVLFVSWLLELLPGVEIDGFWTSLVIVVGLVVLTAGISTLLALDDDAWFDRRTSRQARKRSPGDSAADVPGVVFVQLDGVAHDVLRRAIRSGDVPNLHRWLRDGSHHVVGWETGWSSQTGVSQYGILHGSTVDMPAFRWLDKSTGEIIVSNHPASAAAIERAHSDGNGLLAHHGSSYGNLFSGDADRAVLHSGPERVDTLAVLRDLDRQIGRIERTARWTPRPYKIVVLSDHGQTQGATFRQRTGQTLAELVAELCGEAASGDADAEAGRTESSAWLRHARHADDSIDTVVTDVPMVLGSGSLGLISIPGDQHRLTREEIEARYPGLILGLAAHPEIGFVLVRQASGSSVVLGNAGSRDIATGEVVGVDPLGPFGSRAVEQVSEVDGFRTVADLMVNSRHDPELEEVAAFEDQVRSHGGLGGPQTHPFLLYPADLTPPAEPIFTSPAMHRVLKGWLAEVGHPNSATD